MPTNIRRDHPLSGSVMKQHNTPPAPLTILVRVSGRTFLANAQLAGCNWNSPQYFCTQITKNTGGDHPFSGSVMKQHTVSRASCI
jgi:hypothetical protein